jgi:hypothetical protein
VDVENCRLGYVEGEEPKAALIFETNSLSHIISDVYITDTNAENKGARAFHSQWYGYSGKNAEANLTARNVTFNNCDFYGSFTNISIRDFVLIDTHIYGTYAEAGGYGLTRIWKNEKPSALDGAVLF